MIPVANACLAGSPGPCNDHQIVLVGPPLWAIVLGAVVVIATVVALAVLLRRVITLDEELVEQAPTEASRS